MKIAEFLNFPNNYLATVRVVLLNGSTAARTIVTADSFHKAKLLLTRIYGDGNVLSINQIMYEDEEVSEGTMTLSPQQLQVKSLADKARISTQQKKQLQARQAMQKAQAKMLDLSKSTQMQAIRKSTEKI